MTADVPDPSLSANPTNERPHAPPDDTESIYYEGRPLFGGKPGQVILFTVLGIIFLILPIVLRFWMTKWPDKWACLAMIVVGIVLLLIPVFITQRIRYRISNYRIDYERGLIGKDINSLELWHVEDISFHQTLIDRLLGIGTIQVISHDDNMPNLFMHGLPNARKLFEELKQRIISVKRQTGVLKVDTGT